MSERMANIGTFISGELSGTRVGSPGGEECSKDLNLFSKERRSLDIYHINELSAHGAWVWRALVRFIFVQRAEF